MLWKETFTDAGIRFRRDEANAIYYINAMFTFKACWRSGLMHVTLFVAPGFNPGHCRSIFTAFSLPFMVVYVSFSD